MKGRKHEPRTKARSLIRVLVRALGVGIILWGMLVVFHPWWITRLGAVYVQARYGIEVERVETHGWQSFEIYGLKGAHEGVHFEVGHFRGPLPYQWLRWWRGTSSTVIEIENWQIELSEADRPEIEAGAHPNPGEVAQLLGGIFEVAKNYLPEAVLMEGRVKLGERDVEVDQSIWDGEAFHLAGVRYERMSISEFHVVQSDEEWQIRGAGVMDDTEMRAVLSMEWVNREIGIKGLLEGIGGPLRLSATFNELDWIPNQLRLEGESLVWHRFFPELAFGDEFVSDLAMVLDEDQWQLAIAGSHFSSEHIEVDEPFEVDIRASGNFEWAEIEAFAIRNDGILVVLNRPVGIDLETLQVSESAKLAIEIKPIALADRTDFLESVVGELSIRPVEINSLNGTEVVGELGLLTRIREAPWKISLSGAWEDRFPSFLIELREGNEVLVLEGVWDRAISAWEKGGLQFNLSSTLISTAFPEWPSFEELLGTLQFMGPMDQLSLVGQLGIVDLQLPHIHSIDVTTQFSGDMVDGFSFDAEGRLAERDFDFHGLWVNGNNQNGRIQLDSFTLHETNETIWTGRFSGGWDHERLSLLKLNAISTKNQRIDISLQSEEVHRASMKIQDVNEGLLNVFLKEFPHQFQINSAEVDGVVSANGGVMGSAMLDGQIQLDSFDYEFHVGGGVELGDNGILFDEVVIDSQVTHQIQVAGLLPLRFGIPTDGLLSGITPLDESVASLKIRGSTPEGIKEWLTHRYGVNWETGKFKVDLTGAAKDLALDYSWVLDNLTIENEAVETPIEVDSINLSGRWNRTGLLMQNSDVRSYGEIVEVELANSMSLPDVWISRNDWQNQLDEFRKNLSGSLRVSELEIAKLGRVFPQIPLQAGRLSGDLRLEEGLELFGSIQLRGASTRVFADGTRVQRIESDLRMEGDRIYFENTSFHFRNQSIQLGGWTHFDDWPNGEMQISLRSKDLALIRNQDLIVRSDIDLRLEGKANEPKRIQGRLSLKDSVFIQDLRSYFSSGPRSNAPRAPYFSVKNKPFNEWVLDVEIQGDEFMRIETPAFRGLVSVDLRLRQTLENPEWFGEVTLPVGRVRFPFGTLSVDEGLITLNSDESLDPQLNISAVGRSYGYDIEMFLSGTAVEPVLDFRSSPSLPTENILLLLTSGYIPDTSGSATGEIRTSQVASYFGRGFLSSFSNSYEDESTLLDRIEFFYGTDISESGRETFELLLRLNEHFLLNAEYDRFDAYNANLKWKFFEKE